MSLHQFEENECVLTTQRHCPCIEFVLEENERHGFQASQLLHYRLETTASDNGRILENLTVAFATADVRLTGLKLDRIAEHIRDGNLLAVRILTERYANLVRPKPHVFRITVTLIEKA